VDEDVTQLRSGALRGGCFGPSAGLRRSRGRSRLARRLILVKLWILGAVLVAGSLAYLRLDQGPIAIQGMSAQVVSALEQRLGPDWTVALAASALTLHEGSIALAVDGLDVLDAAGRRVVHAPRAVVGVGALSLLRGAPLPRAIALTGVELRAAIADDGAISLLPPQAEPPPPRDGADPGIEDASAQAGFGTPVAALAAAIATALDDATPVGALDRVRLDDARLTLVDARGRARVAFTDVDMRIWSEGGARRFAVDVSGPGGTWSSDGFVRTEADGRAARIAVREMPVRDIALIAGLSGAFGSDDLTLSGSIELGLAPDDAVRAFSAELATNSGRLRTRDPFMPLVPVERAALLMEYRPQDGAVAIERLEFAGGRTRFALAGALRPDGEGGFWRLALEGRDAVVRGATDADPVSALSRIVVRARGGPGGVVVEEVALQGPDVDLAMGLSFAGLEDRGGLRVALRAADMPVRTALALWPDFTAPLPRLFLRDAMGAGTLRSLDLAVTLTGEDIAGLFREESLPHEAIAIDFAIDEARLDLGEAFPPLRGLSVTGSVDGRDAEVVASSAHVLMADGRRLDASRGRFLLEEFWDPQVRAQIAFSASGGLDALASFLSLPALAGAANLALDPGSVSGDAALDVGFAVPINEPVEAANLPISAQGRLENVSAELLGGDARLEGGSLALRFSPDGTLALDGEGTLDGTPVMVSLLQPRGRPGEARLSGTLDARVLAERGFLPAGALSGPLQVAVAATLGPDDALSARIEADLAGARVDGLLPGWSKRPGAPGRFSVEVASGPDGIVFDAFALDAGSVALAGSGRLDAAGDLVGLDLSRFRLSPGDDASATVRRRESGGYAARIEGNVLDLRPVVTALRAGSDDGGGADGLDLALEARLAILGGFGGEVLTNVVLDATLADGVPVAGRLEGRFPNAAVTGRIASADGGAPRLTFESADAGATLRFLDIYDKMVGGRLFVDAGISDARAPGQLIFWNFIVRDEEALRRLVSRENYAGAAGGSARFGLSGPAINVNEALFTKAQVDFIRDRSVVTTSDARIWGPQVGFTLDGWVDLERRVLDLAGVFVPAYGLNNAFAQVPVVGALLGGNQYEGLFAVNFRLSGALQSPELTVNPLSAIAPGVLRRLFGAGAPTRRSPDLGEPARAPPLDIAPPRQ